ncbi:hypothetical protein QO010_004011 [Caulobacter ginsengisoli]|uniref:Ankyrin repeat domain-containing protein n=1 Tax=Caulobacter ginsengisoli TaxID=400775 RepID=A0ABU0IW20_9CAUL|nr:ankyrin repeat domain-containing protein [Caulobacter ginsengisoli]MDQ0466218.1 hypothetical protein [Caulobacter ginsengisoli]
MALPDLLQAIVDGDGALAERLLAETPGLATAVSRAGATRQDASPHFFQAITHYLYAGDTALHIAAAAYRPEIARTLIGLGASVRAANRRGARPLHYAADGHPDSPGWNPTTQAATIAVLLAAGADPNAADRSGTTPLHRAVRTGCAGAVRALLAGGADPRRDNGRGSTPVKLAEITTGRGGSGSPTARALQAEILELLR